MCTITAMSASADAPDYSSVPRATAIAPGNFRDVFSSSRSAVVRIAVFGDSQETEPSGWGDYYISNLNARFAETFGPPTESNLFSNTWAGLSPRWLGTVRPASASAATTVQTDALLPGFSALPLIDDAALPLPDSRFMLLQDAARTRDPELQGGSWIDTSGEFAAEILAVARADGGALAWRNEPVDEPFTFTGTVVQEGTLQLPRKASPGTFVWLQTPPLSYAGRAHAQLVLRGASSTQPVEVVGVRFRSTAPQRGVVLQSFSRGGMRASDYCGEHGDAGMMLRAYDPSIVVLHYGTNDAPQLGSLSEWKTRLIELIAMLRQQAMDPTLPVILAAELRCGSTPAAQAMIDRMPIAAHEIALTDPNILALNLPRITAEEFLWDQNSYYLADPVHFDGYAQRYLARAFVGQLLETLGIADPNCQRPSWADCVRTLGASCQASGCRIVMDGDALENGLAWSGARTTCVDADGDGESDLCVGAGPADINGDGLIDAADLTALLLAWGHSASAADITGDGVVDAADLANLLLAWGT